MKTIKPALPSLAEVDQVTEVATLSPILISPPSFPIVGIGASAGGLAAFEAFFSAMPADAASGMTQSSIGADIRVTMRSIWMKSSNF
jgi:chemotaxis response regulator CheB